ncbi:hypothetical protein ACFYY8_18325 [Streptosporangium sp. NPDC001559]|uniref:hypothetical protein n=1 Tax=Streptosporangium sp. NPDC001559 TaxID=3366187 RepID=UPI0036EE7481
MPIRPATDTAVAARDALAAMHRHFDRYKLSANTAKAYKRQTSAYTAWMIAHADDHDDAFADVVGAEATLTAWRRHLTGTRVARLDQPGPGRRNPAVRPTRAAHRGQARPHPKPGESDALTRTEQGRVERAAARRGVRDRAIVATLLYAGTRAEECARLEAYDVMLTARTGHLRLHGKGDEIRTAPELPLKPIAEMISKNRGTRETAGQA